MANPTLQKHVEQMEDGQAWANQPNVMMSPRATALSNKAEEYIPINQRPPIPRRIIRNNIANTNLNALRRNLSIKANINKIRRNLTLKTANNARKNYKNKMKNFMRVRSTAIPLENLERNLTRPSRKGRKASKTRKSRK